MFENVVTNLYSKMHSKTRFFLNPSRLYASQLLSNYEPIFLDTHSQLQSQLIHTFKISFNRKQTFNMLKYIYSFPCIDVVLTNNKVSYAR